MIAVYRFLSTYEWLIFLILTISGVFLLRWLWRTWSIWRGAVFGLEREISRRRFARAIGAERALAGAFWWEQWVITSLSFRSCSLIG